MFVYWSNLSTAKAKEKHFPVNKKTIKSKPKEIKQGRDTVFSNMLGNSQLHKDREWNGRVCWKIYTTTTPRPWTVVKGEGRKNNLIRESKLLKRHWLFLCTGYESFFKKRKESNKLTCWIVVHNVETVCVVILQ